MTSPNQEALTRLAGRLGPLVDELVFVGGRVVELLVTAPAGMVVRPTDDSDAVSQATSRLEQHRLEERLRAAGFANDVSGGAPICRWRCGEDVLDVMPVEGDVLGFTNAWFHHVLRDAWRCELGGGLVIRVASAPAFLATKWEAFGDRGGGAWYGNADVEDIVTVVAGRPSVVEEVRDCDAGLRSYLVAEGRAFLASGVSEDVLASALPDSRLVPGLAEATLARFRALASLT